MENKDKRISGPSRLGARLLAARRAAGLSTWRVADELSKRGWPISHATVANYERERTTPPLTLLAALADLYHVAVTDLLRTGPVLEGVQYRCLKSVSTSQKQRFEALSQRWLEAYQRVERKVADPLANRMPAFRVHVDEDGAGVADRLRSELQLADRPVPSVVAVLELFAIRVIEVSTEDRIDGLAARLAGEKVVVLNSSLSPDRIRLNAAHELGHHLFEDVVDGPSLPSSEVEKRAFAFGSNFLLPQSQLCMALQGLSAIRLLEYKQTFGVSMAAMIFRAKEAGLISSRVYQKFWMETSKRGWRTKEPGTVMPDRATRFERILETAVMGGVMSWSQAAKIAGVREEELRERLAGAVSPQGGGSMN